MDTTAHRTPGQELEHSISVWIQDHLAPAGVNRPYIWPGSWPDQDLLDMSGSLPGWHFDSAWIYYQIWDPEIPLAVSQFNQSQDRYWAVVIDHRGIYQPPRDLIAVFDRSQADQLVMAMWLMLGANTRKKEIL